jgi:glycosyltransferase involved in cell wall biosynthesis
VFEGFGCDAVTSWPLGFAQPPVTATLYDLIPLNRSGDYLDQSPLYRGFYEEKLRELQQCNHLLSISEYSKQQAQKLLNYPPDKITNIGGSTSLHTESDAGDHSPPTGLNNLQLRNRFTKPFILYIGGADPRKNLPVLIKAFGSLPRHLLNAHNLLICGKIPPPELRNLQSIIRHTKIKTNNVIFAQYVSDADLRYLYSECALFVLPSLEEGFGLPALEAMSLGAVAIAGNNSSLPEVIGHPEALFDASSVSSLRDKLVDVLANEDLRAALKSHNLAQVKKFSWNATAKAAWETFERGTATNRLPSAELSIVDVDEICDAISVNPRSSTLTAKDCDALAGCIDQNVPSPNRPPRFFVDISELVQRDAGTGVQRVTRSILNVLLAKGVDGFTVNPVYATIDKPGYRYAGDNVQKFGFISDGEPAGALIDVQPGDIFLGLDLQHHVVDAQMAFLRFMRRIGASLNFVVYDLLPIQFPDFFPIGSAEGHKTWLHQITSFDGAFCISRAVADELTEWIATNRPERLGKCRVEWFHLGADVEQVIASKGLPADAEKTLQKLKSKPTFLMVGTVEPRKGHQQVLAAFEQLWQSQTDVNLCIVGKEGWRMGDFVARMNKHPEFGNRLVWISGATDEYLELIYTNSSCLIAASYGEGFGLPLVEAAAANTPIIARDIPVFREVMADEAFYFQAESGQSHAASISEWLSLFDQNKHPQPKPKLLRSWTESSAELLGKLCNV